MNDRCKKLGRIVCFLGLVGSAFSCVLFQPKKTEEQVKLDKLIETKVLLAQNKLEQSRPQAALLELRTLNLQYPKNPMILNMLGLVHLVLQNNERALESLEEAHNLEPGNPAYALNLSSAYLSVKESKKARDLLLGLVSLEGYEYKERILNNIALSYEMEGKDDEAKGYFEEALAENPVYYLSMIGLAKLYEKQRNLSGAFKSYKKAAQYCPTCFEAREKLALMYAPRHKEKAVKILDSFISIKEITDTDRERASRLRSQLISSSF